jgi:succinate dehydrogenase assembly factor 2
MSSEDLDKYDRILDENDWDIYYWTTGERPTPQHFLQDPVLALMKEHFKNEAREIIRMPNLQK